MSIRLKPLLWQALVCVATATTAALLYMLFSVSDPVEWTAPILRSHPVPARATVVVAGAAYDASPSQPARPPIGFAGGHASGTSPHDGRRGVAADQVEAKGSADNEPRTETRFIDELELEGVGTDDIARPKVGRRPAPAPSPSTPPESTAEPPLGAESDGTAAPSTEPLGVPAEVVPEPEHYGPRPEPAPSDADVGQPKAPNQGTPHPEQDSSPSAGESPEPPPSDDVSQNDEDEGSVHRIDITGLQRFLDEALAQKLGKRRQPKVDFEQLRERVNSLTPEQILSTARRDLRLDGWPRDRHLGDDDGGRGSDATHDDARGTRGGDPADEPAAGTAGRQSGDDQGDDLGEREEPEDDDDDRESDS